MLQAQTDTLPPFSIDERRSALLLLAGPSGCGKTTFARALRNDHLAGAIRHLLPRGIANAPIVQAKNPTRIVLVPESDADIAPAEYGCILHYALNRLHNRGIKRLEEDPILLRFRDTTDTSITIVTIVVSGKTLAAHYVKRMFFPKLRGGHPGMRLLAARATNFLSYSKVRQAARYRFGGGDQLYRMWEAVIADLCETAKSRKSFSVRVIGVEPAPRREGEPENFRLLYCQDYAGSS